MLNAHAVFAFTKVKPHSLALHGRRRLGQIVSHAMWPWPRPMPAIKAESSLPSDNSVQQGIAMVAAEDALKAKLKSNAEQYSEAQRVRLHRAISWLARAKSETTDTDAQFIFLWIAFNAAYAKEIGFDESERDKLASFNQSLVAIDNEKKLFGILFEQFTGPIRNLLDNKFVFEQFWKALREHDANSRWEETFASSRKAALGAIMSGDTAKVLGIVFDRLYVLRNQLVHGGSTWNSKVNRAQLKEGTAIMMAITPIIIDLMLDHPELDLGEIMYPVI